MEAQGAREEWALSCSGSREPGGRGLLQGPPGRTPVIAPGFPPTPASVAPHRVFPPPLPVQGCRMQGDVIGAQSHAYLRPLESSFPGACLPGSLGCDFKVYAGGQGPLAAAGCRRYPTSCIHRQPRLQGLGACHLAQTRTQGLHTSEDSVNSPCVTCCHPLRRGTAESLQPVAEIEPTPLPTAVPGC